MNRNERQTSPIKICIAFDEAASAKSAELLIKHVASDFKCETQSFQFDELDPPAPCVAAARCASDVDILVIAVRDNRMVPPHVQSWLSLCLGLRDEDAEGALILLVPKANEEPDPDSSLRDYLETVAAIGGLSFFPHRRSSAEQALEKGGLACRTQRSTCGDNLYLSPKSPGFSSLAASLCRLTSSPSKETLENLL